MIKNDNNANTNKVWKTKYGLRRVRHEMPTLEEAVAAAQGLSDVVAEQAEIAGSLMGMPAEQVRAAMVKIAPPRRDIVKSFAFTGPASAPRTVVVERKRRVFASPNRTNRPALGSGRTVTYDLTR
jgi:hypothetical protein